MKRTYYHGTSADNLKAILRNGLVTSIERKIWTPSLDEVYLWSPDALTEAGECEKEWQDQEARRRAYESAQMALTTAKDGRCVVFQIELDENIVHPDDSCANMTGAVATAQSIPPNAIKAVFISPDLSLLRGYFIAIARSNELFSHSFSPLECKVADAFSKAELYLEMDEEYPLEPYPIPRTTQRRRAA